jgi:flagellar FliL protein
MAEKNAKDEAVEADAEGGGDKKPGILSSPVAKIGLLVLLLGVNAVVSFVVVQKVIRPNVSVEVPNLGLEEPEVPIPGELYLIEGLIVNPAGTRATRYLRVAAALEFDAEKNPLLAEELSRREHQFKDLFITELSARTVDELVDARVKEEIREELLARLNRNVRDGQLQNLYFTEYVIQ